MPGIRNFRCHQDDYGDELAGEDWLDGGDGDDNMIGAAGADQLLGGDGADLLVGDGVGVVAAGADTLDGGAGDDELQAGGGEDSLAGGEGDDRLFAGDGNDSVAGGDGADQLAGEAGDDLMDGDGVTLAGWYAVTPQRGVGRVQVLVEAMGSYLPGSPDPLVNHRVAAFDLPLFAARFDAARAADPALARWPLMAAMLDAYLDGWDDQAVGDDLAYRHGRFGILAGIGKAGAGSVLADTGFGAGHQALLGAATLAAGAPAWT